MMTEVTTKIDARLVNPIVSATTDVLKTMANTEVRLKEVLAHKDYTPSGDVSAVIGIIGKEGEGMVALSFTQNLASLIVARLLGVTPDRVSTEDRNDGIGELVNMISGNAKTILSRNGACSYQLSLPTIISGIGHEVINRPRNTPYLVIVFEMDGQIFHLQVSFKSS